MRTEEAQRSSVVQRMRDVVQVGTAPLLTPARSVLLVTLGGSVLLARALQQTVSRAADEGERQLDLFNGSLGRAASSLWPWTRTSRSAPRQRLRPAEEIVRTS